MRDPNVRSRETHQLDRSSYSPDALTIRILPGISPVRRILSLRNEPLEQDWDAWRSVPLEILLEHESALETDAEFLSLHQVLASRLTDGTTV